MKLSIASVALLCSSIVVAVPARHHVRDRHHAKELSFRKHKSTLSSSASSSIPSLSSSEAAVSLPCSSILEASSSIVKLAPPSSPSASVVLPKAPQSVKPKSSVPAVVSSSVLLSIPSSVAAVLSAAPKPAKPVSSIPASASSIVRYLPSVAPKASASSSKPLAPSATLSQALASLSAPAKLIPSAPPAYLVSSSVGYVSIAVPSSSKPAPKIISSSASKESSSASVSKSAAASILPSKVPSAGSVWQPAVGEPFQIMLNGQPDTKINVLPPVKIFDIDMFDTTAAIVAGLHAQGAKVICYFSAGSSETWRPDFKSFKAADMGLAMVGWKGENWLDTRTANVRQVMAARIALAASKGCDAVDPDNVDGYGNDTGFKLTQADSIDFVKFLATTAASYGMSTGLKNSLDILPSVADSIQFCVNEQCAAYSECQKYDTFLDTKPVFHIEYVDEASKRSISRRQSSLGAMCEPKNAPGIGSRMSTVVKLMGLNGYVQYCDGTTATTKAI